MNRLTKTRRRALRLTPALAALLEQLHHHLHIGIGQR